MRKRITYANVAATLALVFSMTGGALAANHYLINSTKQISPKVLKKLKGATGKTGKTGLTGASGANGREGPAGKNGTNGERGPSTAFSANSGSAIKEWPTKANEPQTVLSLSLPAGSFAITGKVLANNNAGVADVECELLAGGKQVDPGFEALTLAASAPGDRGELTMTGTVALAAPSSAEVVCKSSGTSGNYLGTAISAIQVATIG
jgi:collagen type VII alpha